MTSAAFSLAIWLACLFPAAQLIRVVDQIAAAIDPRFSVVGNLHALLAANPGALGYVAAAAVAWLALKHLQAGWSRP